MADQFLSLLTQAWALAETSKGAKGRGSARQGRKVGRPISSGLGGMNPTNGADLKVRPLSASNVPTKIPRNIQSLIAWDSVKVTLVLTTNNTSLVETNFTGALNVHPQASAWQQLYDQWSIPQMTVEFDSMLPPGATVLPTVLYTALDFDNNNNIGSITAIEDFSSCEVVPMTAGRRTMRSVRPSVKLIQGLNGGGTSISGPAGPMWVDSGQLTTSFYCIRSILAQATSSYNVNTTFTVWFCFRNQI
jgi:hypothetical protein